MNICFIIPQVMQNVSGGLSVQVHNTAQSLKEKGVAVTFFNPWERYDWKKFDLVHIFKADNDTYNIAKWLYESNIPFVVSPVFYNLHNPAKIRLFLALSKMGRTVLSGLRTDLDCVHDICQFSLKVLPNTNAEKKFIEKGIGINIQKIKVIPNGVEERFAQADPTLFIDKYGIKDFILSVSNFGYKRKNMLNLITALETIDHPAVLIGTIYNNSYGMQCQKKMEKLKNILWLDAIPHDDPLLASAYAACRVSVVPSYFETPGLAALEAAVAGANIVTTPYGGPKEYFGRLAEYINPYDAISIKKSISAALLKDPNPELKNHILETYSYSEITGKLLSVYKEVINNI